MPQTNPELCKECSLMVHCLAKGPADVLECAGCGLWFFGVLCLSENSKYPKLPAPLVEPYLEGEQVLSPSGAPPNVGCLARHYDTKIQLAKYKLEWRCLGCRMIHSLGDIKWSSMPLQVISDPVVPPGKIYLINDPSVYATVLLPDDDKK